jgi:hypothetical protein
MVQKQTKEAGRSLELCPERDTLVVWRLERLGQSLPYLGGYCGKRHHGTPVSARDGLPVETAQVCTGPKRSLLATSKRGLKQGLKDRKRTVILFTDATIITETPPLRARWALQGEPVAVPIIGNRNKRALYAALNIRTGNICMARLEYHPVPGPRLAPHRQEEPEAGPRVGDGVALAAGGLSGTESSRRHLETFEGDGTG